MQYWFKSKEKREKPNYTLRGHSGGRERNESKEREKVRRKRKLLRHEIFTKIRRNWIKWKWEKMRNYW